MGKWPEKAVSESSHELAQLSCLVQVERAACVTFPLCAVKVTHRTGAASENLLSGAVLRSRGSKACRQCRPQPVKVKGAGYQQIQVTRENSGAMQIQTSRLAQ
ncbi:hypothetical protein [Salmonella enterica]|uniref:hypothetical protein n=1 Tax=Salmonella enterica TaxID=28901 RepID=UPI0021D4F223|nr:hypothetical protein [Salmonella enterica]